MRFINDQQQPRVEAAAEQKADRNSLIRWRFSAACRSRSVPLGLRAVRFCRRERTWPIAGTHRGLRTCRLRHTAASPARACGTPLRIVWEKA